jgi:hypothetical protein
MLSMNKNVDGAGLQTKSASLLPLRGNSRLASQQEYISTGKRSEGQDALDEQEC